VSESLYGHLETEDGTLTLTPIGFGFLQLETVDTWNGMEARICLTLEQVERLREGLSAFLAAESTQPQTSTSLSVRLSSSRVG